MHLALDQREHRSRAAFVGNVIDLDARRLFECLHHDVMVAAVAGATIKELAGVRLRFADQVVEGSDIVLGACGDRVRKLTDQRHRPKRFQRLVRHILDQVRSDDQH